MTGKVLPQPEVLVCTDSTNRLLAQRFAAGSQVPYAAVIARHQRTGKGRLGHSWYAPADSSLLFSTLVTLPENTPAQSLGWVPLGAALAVAELIDGELPSNEANAAVKWPNDVLIGDKKVAGILAEYLGIEDGYHWITVGVGLNITQTDEELTPYQGTSLAENGWEHPVTERSLTRLGHRLNYLLHQRIEEDFDQVPSSYRKACVTVGETVQATSADGQVVIGVATDVSPTGGLEVVHDGTKTTITAGEVTLNVDPAHRGLGPNPTTCEECQ